MGRGSAALSLILPLSLADHSQKLVAVTCQFGLSYAADIEQCFGIGRSVVQHLSQRAVMKDYVGRHIVFRSQPQSAFA